jgi:hypothetical protein
VRFFAYSRSWRVEKIRPLLYAFGALPNVKLWLSADKDSGLPADVPEGIRVAWLQVDEQPPLWGRDRLPGSQTPPYGPADGGPGVRSRTPGDEGHELLFL